MYVYIQCTCPVSWKSGGCVRSPEKWSYRQLYVSMWVLGIEPEVFYRSSQFLNNKLDLQHLQLLNYHT